MADFMNTIDALGDDAVIDSIIDRSITEFNDDTTTTVGNSAFYECSSLESVDLPNANSFSIFAFRNCTSLKTINAPEVTKFNGWEGAMFYGCGSLSEVNFPKLTNVPRETFRECRNLVKANLPSAVGSVSTCAFYNCKSLYDLDMPNITAIDLSGFYGCSSLKKAIFPKATRMEGESFRHCSSLEIIDTSLLTAINGYRQFEGCKLNALILRNTATVCTLVESYTFLNSGIGKGTGWIYVPSSLLNRYKSATNWSAYAGRMLGIEDFTVDGTTTGEFTGAWNVQNALTYVTNSNTMPATACNRSYHAMLSPEGEFTISSVTITMGSVDVTDDVYNEETGEINIPTVTGDISITASCVVYKIANTLNGVSNNNPTTAAAPNTSYYAVLTPTGSDPIASVKITMGGVDVTDDVYNGETGEISIPAVTGDISINARTSAVILLSYEVIQGYPASGAVNDKFTTPTGNGATTVYCPVTPGSTIRVSMTEKTTTRFRIGFAKAPLANGVALYHPFTADDTALEKTFTVPDGYTYLMVYLGVTPYPAVEPGFQIEVVNEYQELQYVGANGTQYIDLGVSLTQNMAVEVEVSFDNGTTLQQMGVIDMSKFPYKRAHFGVLTSSAELSINDSEVTIPFDTNKHTYYMSANTVAIDGTTKSTTTGFPVGVNFWLFYRNRNGGSASQNYCHAKVYNVKVYENSQLVHYFIPAVRNADGVVGMRDAVTGTFVTNSGTGNLIAGPYVDGSADRTLKIEQGGIGWDSSEAGKDTQASNRVRTDFIPFSGNSTVSISVPNSTETYKVTLRGYDAAKTYQKGNGSWITLPGTITFAYPYIRVLIAKADDSDLDVSSLYGAVLTVDGIDYALIFQEVIT